MNNSEKVKEYIPTIREILKDLSGINQLHIGPHLVEGLDLVDESILEDIDIEVRDGGKSGDVDISEYVLDYVMDIRIKGKPQTIYSRNPFEKPRKIIGLSPNSGEFDLKLTENQISKIIKFESENIKDDGPSDTLIGELFRAFRYIEYRAGNDGDVYHCMGTPSFKSYLFINSTLSIINYDWLYNKKFDFGGTVFELWFIDNQIRWDGMLFELDFIKIILIDLLDAGIIEDRKNTFDSRDFLNINNN